ncbi:hypothetical protein [Paenibacillus ferrarius]|uniref:hypothetical protein n=1 Tax=Paenibacillus ferrarius TaxID=1469647 RepID=UPI003D297117
MIKIFLYPLWFIFGVVLLGALGIASDVMQLTNFNTLDFINENSPQSYIYIVSSLIVLYFIMVVIGFVRKVIQSNNPLTGGNSSSSNSVSQSIKTRDINNSIIIQSGRDTKK